MEEGLVQCNCCGLLCEYYEVSEFINVCFDCIPNTSDRAVLVEFYNLRRD